MSTNVLGLAVVLLVALSSLQEATKLKTVASHISVSLRSYAAFAIAVRAHFEPYKTKERKEMLAQSHWQPGYQNIKPLSDVASLLVVIKANVLGGNCSIPFSRDTSLMMFETQDMYIILERQAGGRSGTDWLFCTKDTIDTVLIPAGDRLGCSAGQTYYKMRFRRYAKDAPPFAELYAGACQTTTAHYEYLFHLQFEKQTPTIARSYQLVPVKGGHFDMHSNIGGPLWQKWALAEPTYTRLGHHHWNEQGELVWTRKMGVNPKNWFSCKNHQMRNPMCLTVSPIWERKCQYSKANNRVVCQFSLLKKGLVRDLIPFDVGFDEDYLSELNRAIGAIGQLRNLGFVVPDHVVRKAQRAKRSRELLLASQ